MFDPHPHAESLTAAWRQALQRVTHTAVDPKARHRPHRPEVFLFVTTPPATDTDANAELEAPLEAACLAIALAVTGQLSRVPERERKLVRDAARRAILAAQPPPNTGDEDDDDDDDEADALRLLVALAREGVRALSGSAQPGAGRRQSLSPTPRTGGSAWHPPPEALLAMRRGLPDPVAVGGVALHVLGCSACQAALDVASFADARPMPLRAAAASAPAMLAPHDGRLLARRTHPDAEAFAFDGDPEMRLAIYVDASQPVHFLAEGVTTDDMRPGYWAGRCARATSRVEGTLHVGDLSEPWALELVAR